MLSDGRTNTNLRAQLVSGTFWVGTSQFVVQGTQFVGLLILVRLLSPEDFGLMAMCFVVMGVMTIFIEMGLPNALIQARKLTVAQRSSASWVCFGLATAMAGIVILTAPFLSSLFKEPKIVALLRFFSLGFIINALAVVPDAVLRRDIKFKEVGAGDAGRAVCYVGAAVPLALSGFGAWSLVGGELSGAFARLVILTWLSRQRPFGRFNANSLKPLLSFGIKNAGSSLCHSVRLQVDTFIVGRALGVGLLGGYNIIKKIITAPQQRVSWILIKVCFPGFSRIQDDDERLRRAYVKIVSITAFITWPVLAFVIADTAPVVNVLLGPPWSFIVVPLRLMCIAGCSISVVALTGSVVLAKGRAGLDLKLSAFAMAFLTLTMVVSARYGLIGVSTGFLIYTVTSNSISQYYANKILALPFKSFLRAVLPGTITAVAVGVTVHIAGSAAYRLYGSYASVGVAVAAAAVIFAILTYALRRRDIITLKDYVSIKVKPRFFGRLADLYRVLVS